MRRSFSVLSSINPEGFGRNPEADELETKADKAEEKFVEKEAAEIESMELKVFTRWLKRRKAS